MSRPHRCPSRRARHPFRRAAACALLVSASWIAASAPAAARGRTAAPAETLAAAQAEVDAGRAATALPMLDRYLDKHSKDAAAYLLRSNVQFMLGDEEAGGKDLDRALRLDPTLRQGWLNRAALQMAHSDYRGAVDSLERARQLDPSAPDNDLNLGAATLLLGQLDTATEHFQAYLAQQGENAQAYYLVATNYALAGYAAFALRHLEHAVALDERMRMQARADANFADFADNPRFQQILDSESYRPPPGALIAERGFDATYDAGRGLLLPAVIEVLHQLQQPFEPNVEVGRRWAHIWGPARIEISDDGNGQGTVSMVAAAGRYDPAQWQSWSKQLFDALFIELQRQKAHSTLPANPLAPLGSEH